MKGEKYSLKTADGCKRFLAVCLVLIFVFGFIGAIISSNGGKSKCPR